MSRMYAILLDSKGAIQDIDNLPKTVAAAARMSVNAAAARARADSAREVLRQVGFPASYVSPSGGRLAVSQKATNATLEAKVTARQRQTSLARFARGSAKPGQRGATVEVKPGMARYLPDAVFLKLRSGASTDSAHNLGLAIRTKGNAKPKGAWKPVQMRNGMWLLYGPSVSQALLSARDSGIWPNMTDELMDYLESEFNRQMNR